MASMRLKGWVAAVVAGSMLVSSTSAVAANSVRQPDSWAALAALSSGAPAAALCGAAAAAAASGQAPAGGCVLPAVDAPPPIADVAPVAPLPAVAAPVATAVSPLFLVLGVLAAGALIYAVTKKSHNHHISPA